MSDEEIITKCSNEQEGVNEEDDNDGIVRLLKKNSRRNRHCYLM